MASYIEGNGDNKFPNSRIGKTPFLRSLRDFEENGVKLGVEKVSNLFAVKQDEEKGQVAIEFLIMQDMDKIRLYDLDGDGEYVTYVDDIDGETKRKMSIESIKEDDMVFFTLFMPCGKISEVSNDTDLIFYPASSSYPLFKLALENAGALPSNMGNKPFKTTQAELKDALEGFIFIAKCEEIKGKFNYLRMQVEPAEL
jgi:hypothetical protein